jgi:hypothetical protein
MDTLFYADLIAKTISTLTKAVGSKQAQRAFGFADTWVDLTELVDYARASRPNEARAQAIRTVDDSERFLNDRRRERLRQASWSFNAALALVIIGTLIVLVGTVLLYRNQTTQGIVTAGAGAVSNIISVLVFRLNRDANDRLDRIAEALGEVTERKQLLEALPADKD